MTEGTSPIGIRAPRPPARRAGVELNHMLYCQVGSEVPETLRRPGGMPRGNREESDDVASTFMKVSKTGDLVDPTAPLRRAPLEGKLENRDVLVGRSLSFPHPKPVHIRTT